jgi:hypothetical protein
MHFPSTLALLIALVTAVVLTGNVARAEEPFFPVMIWNMAPSEPAELKRIRECGFNVAGFVYPKDLDAVQAAGMKGIVSDPRVGGYDWKKVDEAVARKNVESLVAEVGKHPAVFGYYLRDEPGKGMFGGLATVAKLVKEMAPGKWPYINLFPNYAENWQMETEGYEKYLEEFWEACGPPIMSYDHYALMDDGSLKEGYWQNLEQMRNSSLKHGVPFWNIVLAVGHFSFREPTAGDLRFEVYSTLAYGGKGISYFTYFAPKVGSYRGAAIDQFGHETVTYRNLQQVNLQIEKLAPVLVKLKSDAVYHVGEVPAGCHAPPEKSLILGAGGNYAVGDFTHEDGTRYVILVNKDVVKAHPPSVQWRKPPGKVEMVSPWTGDLTAYEGEQVWLPPGGGVLLRVGK